MIVYNNKQGVFLVTVNTNKTKALSKNNLNNCVYACKLRGNNR